MTMKMMRRMQYNEVTFRNNTTRFIYKKCTPETKAVNTRKDAGKVRQEGPDEIMASMPVKEIVSFMEDYPIEASTDAGTYVCNDVFYSALYELAESDTVVSFTHVPYIEDDVKPVLALETALETVLQYIRRTIG